MFYSQGTYLNTSYVSYSIGIYFTVMRDMATFITGIIKNVIEPINSISDMSPVSVVFRRSIKSRSPFTQHIFGFE
jgi:hypothetical protein